MALKLFELDTSVRVAAKQGNLADNTTYDFFNTFRRAIAATDKGGFSLYGEIEMDEPYFGRRRGGGGGEGRPARSWSLG